LERRKIKKILDAEKIAAGEVVDRPANVVKELIENSIDADAKEIRIIIKKAGKSLIQVIDDGIGIPKDEIEFAFERHTSSKIYRFEDLEHLNTLGFRGEALASIAAVSQVEITSRTPEEKNGVELIIEGGVIKSKKEVSCPAGTDIKVKNIFFNIPARRKFLKSDNTELGHITDVVQRYALAYPEIHFIYRHNDLDILNCPADNDLKTTVFHIYGKKNAKFSEYIEDKSDANFKIYGLLGHPQISRKTRNYSSVFINGRYVISDLIFNSVQEAYEGILMVRKFPFFVIFLELNPSIVDFNVHPKKLEVRFEDETYVYNKIYNVIRKFVEEKFIKKESKYLSTQLDKGEWTEDEISALENSDSNIVDLKEGNISIESKNELLSSVDNKNENIVSNTIQTDIIEELDIKDFKDIKKSEALLRNKYIIAENFPKLKLISNTGQLENKTYIILEGINNETNEKGIFILDQHAASERINKERLLLSYEKSKSKKQRLISPLQIEVSPSEKLFLLENLKDIKKLGFTFEHFGGNTFILRDVPLIIGKTLKIEDIKEIITNITEIGKNKSFSEVKEEIINYIACHRSIRGGDTLTIADIHRLLRDLAKCKDPFHCAHGRPTLRFISYKELDKMFKRIV